MTVGHSRVRSTLLLMVPCLLLLAGVFVFRVLAWNASQRFRKPSTDRILDSVEAKSQDSPIRSTTHSHAHSRARAQEAPAFSATERYGSVTKEQYEALKRIEAGFTTRIKDAEARAAAFIKALVDNKIAAGDYFPKGEYLIDKTLNVVFSKSQHPDLFALMWSKVEAERSKADVVERLFEDFGRPEKDFPLGTPPKAQGILTKERIREIRGNERRRRVNLSPEGWTEYARIIERYAGEIKSLDDAIRDRKLEICEGESKPLPYRDVDARLRMQVTPEKHLVVLDRREVPQLQDHEREVRTLDHAFAVEMKSYVDKSGGYATTPQGRNIYGWWEEAHALCNCLNR